MTNSEKLYLVDAYKKLVAQIAFRAAVTKTNILNVAAAFDTEASSFRDEQTGEKVGLCYVWMFGIENEVVYGRYLDDWASLMKMLNQYLMVKGQRLIVYVHNLKYDFMFFMKYLKWDVVFNKSRRNVLYCRYGNIEIRDSLGLSGGVSLAFIGEHLKVKEWTKKVGDLDYQKIHTPITPLTEKELGYCEADVRVLIQYIREKIQSDGDISKIPYTNTGYVRNFVRNACFRRKEKYMQLIDNLTLTAKGYAAMERAFAGGAVGPNIKMIDKTIKNVVSFDIKSSYPYVMAALRFPMSYGTLVKNKDAKLYLVGDIDERQYAVQATFEFFNLTPKKGNDYCFPISESKCRRTAACTLTGGSFEKPIIGSGRIITAAYIMIDATDLDFDTWSKFYEWTEMRVTNCRIFQKNYLPRPIVESIIEFFNKKTTLDGVAGREAEYMISKNMLNSIYGMMVEKIVRAIYEYQSGYIKKRDPDYVAQIDKYNNKWNRFLYYPWGVWVTAWARWRLYDAIAEVGPDFVYCDTDSVKFINPEKHQAYFNRVNAEAYHNMEECAKRCVLNRNYVIPKNPKGEEKCLGVWEWEFEAKRFKTLGAKRYLVEYKKDKKHDEGELELTVAGTNKKGTLEYLQLLDGDVFENFSNKLEVPAKYSKRLIATFISHEQAGYVTDYLGQRYFYQSESGIHMEPSGYKFSIAERTLSAMEMLLGNIDEELGEIE